MIPVRVVAKHDTLGQVESVLVSHNEILLETIEDMFTLDVASGNVSQVHDFKTSVKRIMALNVDGRRQFRCLSLTEAAYDGQGYSVDCALEAVPTFISTVIRLIIEGARPEGIEKTMVEQRQGRVTVTQRKSSGGYSFGYLGEPQSESELTPVIQELEDLLFRLSNYDSELFAMSWLHPD